MKNQQNQPNQGKKDIAPDKSQPMDPRDKSQQQKNQPNPTNKDTKITNSEDQNKIDEDVEEKSVPRGRKDENNPEINTPVYDPNKTEKKIPDMGDKK